MRWLVGGASPGEGGRGDCENPVDNSPANDKGTRSHD